MMNEKHSSVCYIFREGAFSPVREAKPFRNDFCLDLFQYKGAVYEGRTGLHLCPLQEAEYLDLFIKSHGGIEQVQPNNHPQFRANWPLSPLHPAGRKEKGHLPAKGKG